MLESRQSAAITAKHSKRGVISNWVAREKRHLLVVLAIFQLVKYEKIKVILLSIRFWPTL
jgi:hypothetical protein